MEEHAKQVVEFQVDLMSYIASTRPDSDKRIMSPLPPYYDATQLKSFQSTLGCLYSTSEFLGVQLKEIFTGRSWTMIDVGCGEGIFTTQMFEKSGLVPSSVIALDPAEENIREYRELLTRRYRQISNIDTVLGTIEEKVDDLSSANLILASHSLYATLDHNKKKASEILSKLISKTKDGLTVFLLASEDSYLYTIKRTILGELRRPDRSSYGEELIGLLPSGCTYTKHVIDSYVDVTSILGDHEKLLSWMAYFCRLNAGELDSHFELCQGIVRNAAIEVRRLPESEKARYKQTPLPPSI